MDEPLLSVDEEDLDVLASNDKWAFEQADRLRKTLPQMVGHDRRTEGEVFDRQTLMVLHKLLSTGVLTSLDFPISTGKEANVFRGTTPGETHVAVKIFRINTATFKHVLQYIQGDDRFQGVGGDKKTLVYAWAQKEFRNLLRMREAGVDVPEPWKVLGNVLVTEFLGTEDGAWPRLQQLGRLEKPLAKRFWEKIVADYAAMVNKADLVHADFSEYNILVQDTDRAERKWRPRVIDAGQAVLRNHPMAQEFLDRDVRNITATFRRHRLDVTERDILDALT